MATRIINPLLLLQAVVEKRKSERFIFSKTARTLLCFVALALLPYAVPRLSHFRILPAVLSHPLAISSGKSEAAPLAEAEQASDAQTANDRLEVRPGEIEDRTGHALDHFFA